jgi:thymidylate synthase
MITTFKGKGINELVFNVLDETIMHGCRTSSRNSGALGDCSVVYNAFSSIENPRSRHLNLVGRKNNIFATIAETFWVFAGDDRVDPYLSFFLPRAMDFSDDGISWRGAYGPRLYEYNQLDDVIDQFRNEGIFTRRAVLYIGAPELDTKQSLSDIYDLESTKDRPCNAMCDFFITPDKKLHMNVKSRSGDILWGFGSINIFEWTFLQEFMLQELKREIDPELTLGTYNHHVTNLHLYDKTGQQGYAVLENKLNQRLGLETNSNLKFPMTTTKLKKMFSLLLSIWSEAIETGSTDYNKLRLHIGSAFDVYIVEQSDNLLWDYAQLVSAYICAKNMKLPKGVKTEKIEVNLQCSDPEFINCLLDSSFRKFNIKVQ